MAEWQTLMAQTHLPERACGFDSRSGHHSPHAPSGLRRGGGVEPARAGPPARRRAAVGEGVIDGSGGKTGDMAPAFSDRRDAGRRLAELLSDLADRPGHDLVVLGLPRGGVPVAAEVAATLGAPLDVLVVGKVGVPGHEELALGAVADDGHLVLNPSVISAVGLAEDEVAELARKHVESLSERARQLRGGRAPEAVEGRTAVVVDDGMATGATMRVAVEVVARRGARAVVAAVPVGSIEAVRTVGEVVDRMECAMTPPGFRAVGPWYVDFTQVSDDEVREMLAGGAGPAAEA
jgi:putative phosphoribosyl transferase